MSRISYVNGRYVPHRHAVVHIEDRGYQFSDGVYEVFPVFQGRIINRDLHLERLRQSLRSLRIAWPVAPEVMQLLLSQVLRRNRIVDGGMIYLQITRGVAPRNHAFPAADIPPSLVISARPIDMAARDIKAATGVRVITAPDTRWARCDIKSVSLLANMLAKQKAAESDAFEALFVTRDGVVTECASSTFWIVNAEDQLLTHPLGPEILPGVTRRVVLAIARKMGVPVYERTFTLQEALAVREAFLTSATTFVMPIRQIDDFLIGSGKAGPISLRLRQAYIENLKEIL